VAKTEPLPEEHMNLVNPQYSICEVLREIYHIAKEIGTHGFPAGEIAEKIQYRARLASAMAKKMDDKLKRYKPGWEKDMWDETKDMGGIK